MLPAQTSLNDLFSKVQHPVLRLITVVETWCDDILALQRGFGLSPYRRGHGRLANLAQLRFGTIHI